MERVAWTDERIDDAMRRIEERFDGIEARMDRLEARMDQLIHQQLVFAWGLAGAFMMQFVAFIVAAVIAASH